MTRHTASRPPRQNAGPETAASARGGGAPPKLPISVLVVMHDPDGQVLLLERADRPGFWQSVTGSLDAPDEDLAQAAAREVFEETGFEVPGFEVLKPEALIPETLIPASLRPVLQNLQIQNRYEIYAHWLHRYAPGVTHNTEHVFALWLPSQRVPRLAPREHRSFAWLPWHDAASRCFSPSNADAIRLLADRLGWHDTARQQTPAPENTSAIAPDGARMGDNGGRGAC